ncbi:hypothetical protein FRC12_023588 [Ceratobasidium sp. 428]|nr:hypothetical protein FRC12_023588 [Ceratobasidium sp. 428]
MGEYQYVPLSDIKFVKNREPQQPHYDALSGADRPHIDQPHIVAGQSSSGSPGHTPYDRLAADKPGEQLAPEGAIWKMYVDEAEEHDSELVDGKNRNLDMMLLFAALFSAILTAFIIESKDLLQEDPAELSATLLLAIAQSQQRMEQGTPQILPLIERPEFSSSISARWINGLWFTALVLSLSAALIAMLAKEWLTAFLASRPRPALSHTLLHQRRLQGLVRWRALHIVDFLPTMLHVSLLLFFLGLAIFLWTLDSAMAVAEVILAGATLVFYIATGLLGALNEFCPYVTQSSKYLHAILFSFFRIPEVPGHHANQPAGTNSSNDQLQALLWLIQNTRDPAVGDCACQALAGIEINAGAVAETEKREADYHQLPADQRSYRLELISKLYDAVRIRFTDVRLRLSQEPAENQGQHIARYASAIPPLVYSLEAHAETERKAKNGDKKRLQPALKAPAVSAFEAMDTVWTNDCPGLTPDSYAILTAADLRIVRAVVLARHIDLPSVHAIRGIHALIDEISRPYGKPTDSTAIEMQPGASENRASLFQLQARYSRTLARAGYLMSYHNLL